MVQRYSLLRHTYIRFKCGGYCDTRRQVSFEGLTFVKFFLKMQLKSLQLLLKSCIAGSMMAEMVWLPRLAFAYICQ